MKKLLTILIMMVFLVSGCGSSEANEIKAAFDKMNGLDSYKAKLSITLGTSTYSYTMDTEITANLKNKITALDMNYNSATDVTIKSYVDGNNNMLYTTLDNKNWIKMEVAAEDSTNDFKTELALVNNGVKYEKVKATSEGTLYKIKIKTADFIKAFGEEELDNFGFKVDEDKEIIVEVTEKDGYITKIYMDLLAFVPAIEGVEIKNASITMTFTDFNKYNDLVIPADVISKATEQVEQKVG